MQRNVMNEEVSIWNYENFIDFLSSNSAKKVVLDFLRSEEGKKHTVEYEKGLFRRSIMAFMDWELIDEKDNIEVIYTAINWSDFLSDIYLFFSENKGRYINEKVVSLDDYRHNGEKKWMIRVDLQHINNEIFLEYARQRSEQIIRLIEQNESNEELLNDRSMHASNIPKRLIWESEDNKIKIYNSKTQDYYVVKTGDDISSFIWKRINPDFILMEERYWSGANKLIMTNNWKVIRLSEYWVNEYTGYRVGINAINFMVEWISMLERVVHIKNDWSVSIKTLEDILLSFETSNEVKGEEEIEN